MKKPKLSIEKQVEYMKNNSGIQFNITKEEEAAEFLKHNNYYFKIKAYAKNYEKYSKGENKGKYVNLEFAYLIELSKIDMYFRKLIMKMTLDVEHCLKTQMLRDFVDNDKENGYDIIDELFSKYPYIKENIQNKKGKSACADLIEKHDGAFAVWNIIEVLSFGDFTMLYRLYYEKYQGEKSLGEYLGSIKFLRNAAAHNNCLLNTLKMPYGITIKRNKQLSNFISQIPEINSNSRNKKMKNPVIHDFVALLYVFNEVAGVNIKKYTMQELQDFINDRVPRQKDYFEKNEIIKSHYKFIKKIIDYFSMLRI